MSVIRIVSRYAKSLFDLSKAAGQLDKVHEDVQYAWEVAKTEEFKDFLKNPIIPAHKKKDVFKAVFGDKVDTTVLRTFDAMLEHKREAYLGDFCREFHLLYNSEKKVSAAKLTTAADLSDNTTNELLEVFQQKGLLQKDVDLVKEVKPEILGGFILEFEDQVFNASVAHQLEKLRTKFSENLYTKNL